MKKMILTVAVVLMVFTAIAAAAAPLSHGNGSDMKSYWVRYYHTYFYHTYYTPVVYYPQVYVAPVYNVYPVYTYTYWYYKFAGR